MSSNQTIRSSSSSSSTHPLHTSGQPTLAQQQQQQLQDIKPALLAQSLSYRQKYTYKDKFHSLRERYDQVSATNEALQKELAAAQSKMQKLEAENNLLIDGIGIIAPFETTIDHYMNVQNTHAAPPPAQNPPTEPSSAPQNTNGPPPQILTPSQQFNGNGLSRSFQITMNMMDGQ